MEQIISRLEQTHTLDRAQLTALLHCQDPDLPGYLREKALALRQRYYGNQIYIRGLVELTNYCKNDCYYCGLRCSNSSLYRYRLREEEILSCCSEGYRLGLRTFVLQGGEDPIWGAERIAALVGKIKEICPGCAVTLSLGEHSKEVYRLWKKAGADRYLLRHETATAEHYRQLHPARQSWERRMQCLKDLKEIGYQTGCGFMVGSPGQTVEHLVEELIFLQEFQPHMVGIGPFIPQKDTPFSNEKAGTLEQTLLLLSLIRLLLPKVLLPATTALGTIHPGGRELGFLAGANVCMPNLSPAGVRKHYAIYDNKLSDGAEAVESLGALQKRLQTVGCEMSLSRGDYVDF
jgi:biotin synthase